MWNAHCFLALALLSLPLAAARADDAKIELYDHIAGPAVKTQSLRLMPDGRVVDERYDITTSQPESGPHSETVLCSYSSEKVDQLVAEAATVAGSLPHSIDEGKPIPLDSPSQTIIVAQPNSRLLYVWLSPSDHDLSQHAQQFVHAWQSIKRLLLSCQRA